MGLYMFNKAKGNGVVKVKYQESLWQECDEFPSWIDGQLEYELRERMRELGITTYLKYVGPIIRGKIVGGIPNGIPLLFTFCDCKDLRVIPRLKQHEIVCYPFYGCNKISNIRGLRTGYIYENFSHILEGVQIKCMEQPKGSCYEKIPSVCKDAYGELSCILNETRQQVIDQIDLRKGEYLNQEYEGVLKFIKEFPDVIPDGLYDCPRKSYYIKRCNKLTKLDVESIISEVDIHYNKKYTNSYKLYYLKDGIAIFRWYDLYLFFLGLKDVEFSSNDIFKKEKDSKEFIDFDKYGNKEVEMLEKVAEDCENEYRVNSTRKDQFQGYASESVYIMKTFQKGSYGSQNKESICPKCGSKLLSTGKCSNLVCK